VAERGLLGAGAGRGLGGMQTAMVADRHGSWFSGAALVLR
jgi:hypothetical protein